MSIGKEEAIVKKKPLAIKKLEKFILMMTTTLLDSFLSDDADKRIAKENLRQIRTKLQQAAQETSLVVLQLETEKPDKYEIISGWIVGKKIGKEQVVIKIQNDQQQIRILSLMMIKKVSILSPKGKNDKLEK